MGSNPQPLDSKPNSLPTELRREICGARFKLLMYSAIVATMLHVIASCMIILYKNIIERVLVDVNIYFSQFH